MKLFSCVFILVIFLFASIQAADSFSNISGKRIPVRLGEKFGHPIQCSMADVNCKCWRCFKGFILQCDYICWTNDTKKLLTYLFSYCCYLYSIYFTSYFTSCYHSNYILSYQFNSTFYKNSTYLIQSNPFKWLFNFSSS